MNIAPRTRFLVPLLALGLTLGAIATAHADDRHSTSSSGTSGSIQITFGSPPRWSNVPGTPVSRIHEGDRTNYDIFRYGHNYYAYSNANDRWYMSQRYRGRYMMISDRSVPWQIQRLPRQNWRNYPTAWDDRNYRGPNGAYGTKHVAFTGRPRWTGINGTRVDEVHGSQRPGYDVFRYGGSYYAFDNDQWYRSSRESGDFTMIDDRDVPDEFYSIPRDHWRNYPQRWQDENRDPRSSDSDQRDPRGGNGRWGNASGSN